MLASDDFGEGLTIHFSSTLFFFSFFKVENNSHATRLWTSVPQQVVCDFVYLRSSNSVSGQHGQCTSQSEYQVAHLNVVQPVSEPVPWFFQVLANLGTRFVLLSPTNTSPELSDRSKYPLYLRVTPGNNTGATALLSLVRDLGHQYVQVGEEQSMCRRNLSDRPRSANQHSQTRHTSLSTGIVTRQFRTISFR